MAAHLDDATDLRPGVRRLSGTDSLFLAGETPAWHQHVAGLAVVDPTGVEGFGFDAVVRHVASRMALIPKLTWKLQEVPFHLDRSVWVSDPDFDVRRHVRRIAVPDPGGPREAAAVAGEILERKLDRSRPLWEIWYLDGLVHGRVGFLLKYHHCLLDGVAGSGLAAVLLDLEPRPVHHDTAPPQPEPRSEAEASTAGLLLSSVAAGFASPWRFARYGVRLAGRAGDLVRYSVSPRPKPDVGAMLRAPRTSFNHAIGAKRALAFTSCSLDDARALARHHDVKLNDVALAVCSGGLRTYLDQRGELPERTLTAGVPVSTRPGGDVSLDNQLAYMAVPLATDVADPAERLLAIHRHALAAKGVMAMLRAHPIDSIGTTAPPWMLAAAFRLAYRSHLLSYVPGMMNTLISNVAGPASPLYLAGARITGIYTASVILEGMGVNITVFSFEDRIDFGIHVDPDLVPEPWDLAAALDHAVSELMAAADLGPPTRVEDAFGLGNAWSTS